MTTPIFPVLPGLGYDVVKAVRWATLIQKKASGMESRSGLMQYPLYDWTLQFDLLRGNTTLHEFQTLIGFFNTCNGSLIPFFYEDPSDKSITAQIFGVGDGVTTDHQLVRTLGSFIEPVQSVNGTPTIKIDGTPTGNFTVGATGVVTFETAPSNGTVLTWDGSYYWLCRFSNDSAEFNEFMQNLWELKKCQFTSVKQ